MSLEEILSSWEEDCEIDRSDLGNEAASVPTLHHKYYKMYKIERTALRKLESDLKKLRHAKHVFYVQGPTRETQAKGWVLPPCGKILKSDAWNYVDVDPEVVSLADKMAEQGEVVSTLEDIIKSINNRNFLIRSVLDWLKFTNGVA